MLSDSQGCSKRITVKDWGISKIAHAKSEACGRPAAVHAALSVLFTWSSVPWARSALNACGPSQTHRWFCWNLDGFSIRLIDALLSLRWRFIEDWLMLHWWFRSPLIFFVVLDVCWWCLYDPSTFYWRPDCTAKRQSRAFFNEIAIFSCGEAFPGSRAFLPNAGELWWSQRDHGFECFCVFLAFRLGLGIHLCSGRMSYMLRSGGGDWVWCSCFLITEFLYVQTSTLYNWAITVKLLLAAGCCSLLSCCCCWLLPNCCITAI